MGFLQYLPKKLYFSLTQFNKFYFVYDFEEKMGQKGRKNYFGSNIIYLLLQLSEGF